MVKKRRPVRFARRFRPLAHPRWPSIAVQQLKRPSRHPARVTRSRPGLWTFRSLVTQHPVLMSTAGGSTAHRKQSRAEQSRAKRACAKQSWACLVHLFFAQVVRASASTSIWPHSADQHDRTNGFPPVRARLGKPDNCPWKGCWPASRVRRTREIRQRVRPIRSVVGNAQTWLRPGSTTRK